MTLCELVNHSTCSFVIGNELELVPAGLLAEKEEPPAVLVL
jgi:hypothetical protein